MASYTSTGPAGVDAEIMFSAVMAAHLISEKIHPVLPKSAIPDKLSLQRRDGPAGFDDVVIEWKRDSDRGIVYIQSKRSITIGDNPTFQRLARALAEYQSDGDWSAAIVANSVKPTLKDVQELLDSSRLASNHSEFDTRWSKAGVLNDAKRSVLHGFKSATNGLKEDAAWNAMRRLKVIEHDFALLLSRDRIAGIQTLSQGIENPSEADTIFDVIRSTFLASAHLSPTYNRAKLAQEVSSFVILPLERHRNVIDKIDVDSRSSEAAIKDQISSAECSITLLRPECWKKLEQSFSAHNIVRL